jgi:alpha-D-xyloside xylohydrolase
MFICRNKYDIISTIIKNIIDKHHSYLEEIIMELEKRIEKVNQMDASQVEIDKKLVIKIAKMMIKNTIKYPRLKGKLTDFEPNVNFGLTDHPIDRNATPLHSLFTVTKKFLSKKTACVLKVDFIKREGNSFLFKAYGYNLYKIRDMDQSFAHTYKITEKTPCEEMAFQIDMLRADAYRLRLAHYGDTVPHNKTPMVIGDISDKALKAEFFDDPEKYTIRTPALSLVISKENFSIIVFDSKGNQVTQTGSKTKNEMMPAMDSYPLGFAWNTKDKIKYGVECFTLRPGEKVYGLGEHFSSLNKVGRTITLWQHEGYGNIAGRMYKGVPFFLSTAGYGVFVNESRPVTFWVGSKDFTKNSLAVEGDLLDYYFFYGPSFKTIIKNYTGLTGRAEVLPKWSYGTWMSRISYNSQSQVIEVAKILREMDFPADVINIDVNWFDKEWRCDWQFSKERFPDPKAMFQELAELGFRVCLWQNPNVLEETALFKEAKKKKVLAKNNCPYIFIMQFPARMIDFSNPEAIEWYKDLLKNLFELGAAAIKVDFGEGVEPAMRFKEYDGRQMHNLYPLLYNKAAYEATKEHFGRGIIWARSAYAGSQRYGVHWSGDSTANFENLTCIIRGGLSLGMCGFTYWSQDAGGFLGTCTDEMYIRWTEMSIFQSHIRYHGVGPRYREPWNYSKEAQDIVRKLLKLRYRLIPYLYSESFEASSSGLPLMRAMMLDYQDDLNTHQLEDQFMFGRYVLVAPIMTKEHSRNVYLPVGVWYDFWEEKKYTGGCWITMDCPLDRIPVFIKEGSILPLGREVNRTDEVGPDGMTLKICPNKNGEASYALRDDDTEISINAKINNNTLDIEMNQEINDLKIDIGNEYAIHTLTVNGKGYE